MMNHNGGSNKRDSFGSSSSAIPSQYYRKGKDPLTVTSAAIRALEDGEREEEYGASATTMTAEAVVPQPVPDEPALYYIPQGLSPEYGRIPTLAQLGVWLVSMALSALVTFENVYQRLSWIRPLVAFHPMSTGSSSSIISSIKLQWTTKILSFAMKTVVLALAFTVAIQETLVPPSRISTRQLIKNYFLPSKFSRFETIELSGATTEAQGEGKNGSLTGSSPSVLGVHHLVCEAVDTASNYDDNRTGLIYLNHGFGACSLSWLPAMEPLLKRLKYRTVVAHDAPGFGFTDRPTSRSSVHYLESYTSRGSAAIGCKLIQNLQKEHQHNNNNNKNNNNEPILLMGHSMGAITTLRMALQLPAHVQKRIILVSPALGVRPNHGKTTEANKNKDKNSNKNSIRAKAKAFSSNLFHRVLDPVCGYVLRRAVGRPGFWRSGLELVWGDPTRLSDSNVLRFQWHSIGQGWEKGLLTFSRAQFSVVMEMTDRQLLEKVLALTNTRVQVIYGGSDKVVRPNAVRTFFAPHLNQVELVELPGQGHDPFEEDCDTFVATVEQLLHAE
ncbi:hypothetical protein ACA910_005230 [Epithemia clementina (nom. ined.)]